MQNKKQNSSKESVINLADFEAYSTKLVEQTCALMLKNYSDKDRGIYLSVPQVMKMLGVSRCTLYRWEKIKYLMPVRIGVRIRYKLTDIKKLMKADIL